ncbi:hypothetical protein [Streptomyces sp. A1136]|uniref:hypothetical protein n=1 Tax=Streptomyces sp. A1136 TaxID=2563102 RepID=UPI00109EA302|nr:hypothetical protein [Streptomyces sp. A1136]THA49399.1 hypothetical protein E6R62_27750 [Streptomyces sp. A1136]
MWWQPAEIPPVRRAAVQATPLRGADWMVWLGWVRSPQSIEVRFPPRPGRGRRRRASYTTAPVDAV